jgi:hypothetical protein
VLTGFLSIGEQSQEPCIEENDLTQIILYCINFGPYHNGTARPLPADREYGLKIWSVAAIILSNQ